MAGNTRVSRKTELRSIASICVLRGGELGERASAAIVAFTEDLPFNYEEEREHADHISALRRTAEIWAEVGKRENYRATPIEDGSKVMIEMIITPCTKYPLMTSASLAIGAFEDCALSTSLMICCKTVSLPTRVARYSKLPGIDNATVNLATGEASNFINQALSLLQILRSV